MNLIDALKTGFPFHRRGDSRKFLPGTAKSSALFSYEDLLATDWEVQEELKVTYQAFCKALNGPISPHNLDEGVAIDLAQAWRLLKKAVAGQEIPRTLSDDSLKEAVTKSYVDRSNQKPCYDSECPGCAGCADRNSIKF